MPREKHFVRKLFPAGRLQLSCPQELQPWDEVSAKVFFTGASNIKFCLWTLLFLPTGECVAWHKPVDIILLQFNPAGNLGGCALESVFFRHHKSKGRWVSKDSLRGGR